MATRKIIDIEQYGEKVWPKGHAKATFMSSGATVEDVINTLQGGSGGVTFETDPVFLASPAASITEEKMTEWDKGATAVQPSSLAKVATSGSYNDLTDKPEMSGGDYLPLTGGSMTGPISFTEDSKVNSLITKSLDLHRPIKFSMICNNNQELVGIKQGITTNKLFEHDFIAAYEGGVAFALKLIYGDEECFTYFRKSTGSTIENSAQEIISGLTALLSTLYNQAQSSHIKEFVENLSVEFYGEAYDTINVINKGSIDDVTLEFSASGILLDSVDVYDQKFVFNLEETSVYSMVMMHPYMPLKFTQYTLDSLSAAAAGCDFTYQYLAKDFTRRFSNHFVNRPVNGKSEGLFVICEGSDANITGTVTTAETLKGAPVLDARNNTLSISVGGQTGYVNLPFGDDGSRIYYYGSKPTSLTVFGDAEIVGDHIAEYGFGEGVSGVVLRYLQFSKPVKYIPSNAFTIECGIIYIPPTVNYIDPTAFTVHIPYIYADNYIGDMAWCTQNSKLQTSFIVNGNINFREPAAYPWFFAETYVKAVWGARIIPHKSRFPHITRTSPCLFYGAMGLVGISNYTARYTESISGKSFYIFPPYVGSIIFTIGDAVPSITYIGEIKWVNGIVPTLQPNKTYEMSFNNGLAVCAEY
jgi:hypothetical protein